MIGKGKWDKQADRNTESSMEAHAVDPCLWGGSNMCVRSGANWIATHFDKKWSNGCRAGAFHLSPPLSHPGPLGNFGEKGTPLLKQPLRFLNAKGHCRNTTQK